MQVVTFPNVSLLGVSPVFDPSASNELTGNRDSSLGEVTVADGTLTPSVDICASRKRRSACDGGSYSSSLADDGTVDFPDQLFEQFQVFESITDHLPAMIAHAVPFQRLDSLRNLSFGTTFG